MKCRGKIEIRRQQCILSYFIYLHCFAINNVTQHLKVLFVRQILGNSNTDEANTVHQHVFLKNSVNVDSIHQNISTFEQF